LADNGSQDGTAQARHQAQVFGETIVKKPKNSGLSDSNLDELKEQWALAILIGGLLLATFAMLYPIHFDSRDDASFAERIVSR
jgi:hypothetical protein